MLRGLVVRENLVDAEGNIGKLESNRSIHAARGEQVELTRRELSTGFPRPLPIPQEHRKIAQVMAAPIRIASTLPISGKVVILHRKYTELEITDADTIKRPICDLVSTISAPK